VPNGDRRGNWKLQTLRHVGTAQTDVAASQFRYTSWLSGL